MISTKRIQRKAQGLCTDCGKSAQKNRTRCADCLKKSVQNQAHHRQKRKDAGLCPRCGKRPPRENKATCQNCADETAKNQRKRRAKWKSQGLCARCGRGPPKENHAHCQKCIDFSRNYQMGGLRTPILERDNRECRICSGTKRLTVHHIDGRGEYDDSPNHNLDNLITLCAGCHNAITRFRRTNQDKQLAVGLILA